MTSTYVPDLSGPRVVADAKAAYATPGPLTTVWLDVTRATEEVLARAALLTDGDVLVVDDVLPELAQGVAASLRWHR